MYYRNNGNVRRNIVFKHGCTYIILYYTSKYNTIVVSPKSMVRNYLYLELCLRCR